VTAPVTTDQDLDCISEVVHEAIHFDFYGEHPDHGEVDLTVGFCDDAVKEGGMAILRFPTLVIVFDPDLVVAEALSLVVGLVRDAIEGWYETPEGFEVSFIGLDGSREGRS
jgi:hypothetical protein